MVAIPTMAEKAGEREGMQVGREVSRVDGRLKVTGEAKYAAEFHVPGLLHGYIVSSAITKGRITKMEVGEALKAPGVVHVFTHENRPRVAWFDRNWQDEDAPKGSPFRPLYDEKIVHAMQPVALERSKYTFGAHSAVFVEVKVDEKLGTVGVSRVVNAVAAGRMINPKTAGCQVMGAVVMGIGMALEEETFIDHRLGRYMNHDLAEYHVPVNKDIGDIQVIFVEEHDRVVNPLGARGVGEIGIVGVPAAIANAVFHATGRRVRDLAVTVDKVMGAEGQ